MEEDRGTVPPKATDVWLELTTAEQDEMRPINRRTDRMYPTSTIRFAIQQGKSEQMIEQHHRLVDELGIGRREYTGALDDDEFRYVLEDVHPEQVGKYQHKVLRWVRGNFRPRTVEVTYGNCPNCFRAYPLGQYCVICGLQTKTLYFVRVLPTIPPNHDHTQGPIGIAQGKPCEPLELADLMGHREAIPIYLDYQQHIPGYEGYDPDNKSLYQFITFEYLTSMMGTIIHDQRDDLEVVLKGTTNAPESMVQAVVDSLYDTRVIGPVVYGAILLRRAGNYTPTQQIALEAYRNWGNDPNNYEEPW